MTEAQTGCMMRRDIANAALRAGKIVAVHFFGPLIFALNLLLCAPFLYAGEWFAAQLDQTVHFRLFAWIVRGLLLGLIAASLFASVSMGRYFVDEAQPFLYSLKTAWLDVWHNLQWLPLVGHWFERKPDPREVLEDDEPGERPPPVE